MRHYKPFQFKEFSIAQNNAAMKVGTDSVLLGSWAKIAPREKALDIGTGTGILSLMLAQKVQGNCQIDAIEIDNQALIDAQNNFINSPWPKSVTLINQDFNLFNPSKKYDVIISNPPFFEGLAPSIKSRSTARNASDKLSYEVLIEKASQLMSPLGRTYIILPIDYFDKVIMIVKSFGLALQSELKLSPKITKNVNRALIHLVHQDNFIEPCFSSNLIIRNDENSYTNEHKLLTKDFYL